MKNIIFFHILFLIISFPAVAQIVNVESARMQSDTIGFQGGVGMGYH